MKEEEGYGELVEVIRKLDSIQARSQAIEEQLLTLESQSSMSHSRFNSTSGSVSRTSTRSNLERTSNYSITTPRSRQRPVEKPESELTLHDVLAEIRLLRDEVHEIAWRQQEMAKDIASLKR